MTDELAEKFLNQSKNDNPFYHHYSDFCHRFRLPAKKSIVEHLRHGCIDANLVDLTEDDLSGFLKCLLLDRYQGLTSIRLTYSLSDDDARNCIHGEPVRASPVFGRDNCLKLSEDITWSNNILRALSVPLKHGLRTVVLKDLSPSTAGLHAFCLPLIANVGALCTLSFVDINLNEVCFAELKVALKANHSISDLTISGCGLNDPQGKILCDLIVWHGQRRTESERTSVSGTYAVNPTGWRTLDFSRNNFTDHLALPLAEVLKYDAFLCGVNLEGNRFTSKGAAAFASVPLQNKFLRSLKMSCPGMPEYYMTRLNESIHQNSMSIPVSSPGEAKLIRNATTLHRPDRPVDLPLERETNFYRTADRYLGTTAALESTKVAKGRTSRSPPVETKSHGESAVLWGKEPRWHARPGHFTPTRRSPLLHSRSPSVDLESSQVLESTAHRTASFCKPKSFVSLDTRVIERAKKNSGSMDSPTPTAIHPPWSPSGKVYSPPGNRV